MYLLLYMNGPVPDFVAQVEDSASGDELRLILKRYETLPNPKERSTG